MPNKTLNKWGIVLIRLVGLTAFIWQIIQFFYSKWTHPLWFEVFMVCLFIIISRYPSKVLVIFDFLINKFNIKMKDEKTKEEVQEKVEETTESKENVPVEDEDV